MGYYSDAALALNHEGVNVLEQKLNREIENAQEVRDFLKAANCHYKDLQSNAEIWQWLDVKWYLDDPEINFIERFMSDIDDENYRFIRIGEDYDDTEVRGYFIENPFDLELSRTMTLKPA